MITFGSNLITIRKTWSDLKIVASTKGLLYQYEVDPIFNSYCIFCVDNTIVYCTDLFIGDVPTSYDYTQDQNDSDKSDWETNYKNNANGVINPRTTDGRLAMLPNLFPNNMQLCFPGAGDDPVNGIGKGTLFQHTSTDLTPTTHNINWQFNDWVYLSGGHMVYQNANIGDTIGYTLFAAANTVTTVSGTGNVNCVGPGNVLIVPGTNTNSQINLSTAIPVPSLTNTGWWDWTPPTNGIGAGTIIANLGQTGGYNLYTIQITLGNFVINYPLLGSNYIDLTVPAILPKRILPQWTHRVQVYNSGHSGLQVVWALTVARTVTTGM